jgi:hypothetical protein
MLGLCRAAVEKHSTPGSKNNLAAALNQVGQNAEARRMYEEVIEEWTALYGGGHIETLRTKGNLADLLSWQIGEFAQARPLLEEVVAGRTAQLPAGRRACPDTGGTVEPGNPVEKHEGVSRGVAAVR